MGEGGEYGSAQAKHVLTPYTIGTEEGIVTGTMPNRGGMDKVITNPNEVISIPEGYHNGAGKIKVDLNESYCIFTTTGTLYDMYASVGGVDSTSLTYEKKIEKRVRGKGKIRVTFSLRSDAAGDTIAYARIYINDVPIGIERRVEVRDFVEFTEEISVNYYDKVQIYMKTWQRDTSRRYSAVLRNFAIASNANIIT